MKSRRSWWCTGLLALGLAFSTAAIGCGDDDDPDTGGTGGGGSGGTSGRAGSTAGRGGTGGSAGRAGSSGGGATTPAACVTQTTNIMKDQAGSLSAACVSCICDANAAAIIACDNNAQCWPLIQCVATKCAGMEAASCAPTMCTASLSGATQAMAAGQVLQGSACASKCSADGGDAGVDAGF